MSNKPLTGCLGDEESSPSVILFRQESFEKIMKTLIDTYGSAGFSMIYSLGKNVGQSEFRSIMEEQKNLCIPMTRPKLLKKVLERFTYMGWGKFAIESLELNSSAIVVITKNIFSKNCSRDSVGCCFIQGLIAGLMSEVFESEPIYDTPRCFIQENERCLFRLKSQKYRNIISDTQLTHGQDIDTSQNSK
jgi:predicted hydrocarbon binding protein